MRLIDADSLEETLTEMAYKNNGEKYDFFITARSWVKDEKIVDAMPVVHSRWVEPVPGDGFPYCANCKKMALDKGLFLNPKLMEWYRTKYCPNCGALMDGKEE